MKFARYYRCTAEFLARQGQLFSTVVQRASANAKAELRANLEHIKKQWRTWFPKPATPAPHQLVIEADDFHQITLCGI